MHDVKLIVEDNSNQKDKKLMNFHTFAKEEIKKYGYAFYIGGDHGTDVVKINHTKWPLLFKGLLSTYAFIYHDKKGYCIKIPSEHRSLKDMFVEIATAYKNLKPSDEIEYLSDDIKIIVDHLP